MSVASTEKALPEDGDDDEVSQEALQEAKEAIKAFQLKKQDAPLGIFLERLRTLTVNAAKDILKRPGLIEAEGGYIDAWYVSYSAFKLDETNTAFLAARYGYAVERLVMAKMDRNELSIKSDLESAGYRYGFQAAHGHTRPDVVVIRGTVEIGWYDITSEASKGHIFTKMHSGWKTKSQVGEALYPSLVFGELLKATATSDKERQAIDARLAAARRSVQRGINGLKELVFGLSSEVQESGDMAKRRKEFETRLYEQLDNMIDLADIKSSDGKFHPQVAKSLLYIAGDDSEKLFRDFGYDQAHKGGRRLVDAQAIMAQLTH